MRFLRAAISQIGGDLRSVLQDTERRWFSVVILAYFALLPFTAFGIALPRAIPVIGQSVKFTEIALLAVGVAGAIAYARGRLRLVRAPWLYAFLILNAAAQFWSLTNAENLAVGIPVAVAVARYSILVFLLVNVLRHPALIRAALTVMGCSGLLVVSATFVRYLATGGTLRTDLVAFAVGSPIPHVLGYATVFFGCGLVYLFLRSSYPRSVDVLLLAGIAIWTFVIAIAYVKIAQIALALALGALLVTAARQWRKAALVAAVCLSVFAYRFYAVDIDRAIATRRVTLAARAARVTASPPRVDERVVAEGIRAAERAVADAGAVVTTRFGFDALASVPERPVDTSIQPPTPSPSPFVLRSGSARPPETRPSPETPPTVPPPAVAVAPEPTTAAPSIDPYYHESNRLRRNWASHSSGGSLSIRKRGIAIGWVLGRASPWTGIGAGQTSDRGRFAEATAIVRSEARVASPFSWKRYFFVDEEILAARADEGLFNIFMNAWAETGAPGLLALVGILAAVGVMTSRALLRAWRAPVLLPIAVLAPFALALLFYHQTVYLWVHPWLWTMLALTYAAARSAVDPVSAVGGMSTTGGVGVWGGLPVPDERGDVDQVGRRPVAFMRAMVRGLRSISERWPRLRRAALPWSIYVVLIVAVTPPYATWSVAGAFYGYALIIGSGVWRALTRVDREGESPWMRRWSIALLVAAAGIVVVTRLLPFLRYGAAPLGYDTGFYLSSIDASFHSIASGYGHRNTRALLWIPFEWLGVDRLMYLHALYVLSQFLIAGAVYVLSRTLAPRGRRMYAASALLLFALSVPQFFAYWWMFYQTSVAVALLLMTLALIHRRSWFAIATGLVGAAIHPATFLPFGIALALYLAVQLGSALVRLRPIDRDTQTLLLIAVAVATVAQTFSEEIRAFITVYLHGPIRKFGWFYTNYPLDLRAQFTGLYVNRTIAHLSAIYMLPFAAFGIALALARRLHAGVAAAIRTRFLLLWIAVLVVLTSFPFIYQHRFLIYFDLTLILIAAYPFAEFLREMLRDWSGRALFAILLFGYVLHTGLVVWHQTPQVYPDELAEIRALAAVDDEPIFAVATESPYTPWLLAFSGHEVVDPGYLQYNRWTYDMWNEFWNGESDARRHELLRMYRQPLYLFTGRKVRQGAKYLAFIRNDAHFERVSAFFWRYDPRTVSEEEVEALRYLESLRGT